MPFSLFPRSNWDPNVRSFHLKALILYEAVLFHDKAIGTVNFVAACEIWKNIKGE